MNKALKILLPIAFIAGAIVIVYVLFATRPQVEHKAVEIKRPMVSVTSAHEQSVSIPVQTRGSVSPGTEIQLTSEVGGQVTYVSENLANGGFFRKGEVLVKVDPLEYDVNIKRAQANKAQAEQHLIQARAEQKARSRVSGSKSALARFDVQVAQAKAAYEAAKAELEAARMQKTRTIIKAPFDGRVRLKNVNVGQYVRPGFQLAQIYAVDVAEVRLPLSDRQLGLVDVPLSFSDYEGHEAPVKLIGEYGGKRYEWYGKIVRTEGGMDERNRLLYVVAQVADPYKVDPDQPTRPPLTAGSFVEAEIQGRHFDRVFVIPRRALRNGNQVWIVDQDDRLKRREVEVVYKGKHNIYVSRGLDNGDRIVLSQLDIAVDGMKVRPAQHPDHQLEISENQNQTLFGNETKPRSETDQPRSDSKGMTRSFSKDEVLDIARQAKAQYQQLDDEAKQKLKQDLGKIAESVKKLSEKTKEVQQRVAQRQSQPVPAASETPGAATAEQASENNSSAARAMSPLASLIEEEVNQQQAPVPTAKSKSAPQSEPSSAADGSAQSQRSVVVITKVAAPKPLAEAVQ